MVDGIAKRDNSLTYVHSGDVYADVCRIIERAQLVAQREVDVTYVRRNWLLGRRIAEEELGGDDRARYGANIVPKLAEDLTARYGKGYTKRSLWKYVRFYRTFPAIVPTVSAQSRPLLSWSHYEELMRVEDDAARAWYEREAQEQTWSVRTLRRNINTQYYERLLSTQAGLKSADSSEQSDYEARLEFVKNPLMAEFLGLPADTAIHESQLEGAIIANLQQFLLELGKGYAFIARQQHIRTDAGDFFIDLVFYNVILKCYVLIDLKVGQITHQDVGQMDMYVRMYDELKRTEGDGPTLGIVLCSETSKDIAHYSVLNGSEQLFASKYKLYLPTEAQLRAEIESQKEIFARQLRSGDDASGITQEEGRGTWQ